MNKKVEHDGPLPHGQRREHAQHVGYARDGRGAQQRPGNQCDAEGIDEQRHEEQGVTADKVFIHDFQV